MNKEHLHPDGRPYTKEEFIERIKTDGEFAKKWGNLGPIYGKQWRAWTKNKMYLSTDGSYEKIYDEADQTVIDQIAIAINLLKTDPDSRRNIVSAWAVHDLQNMVLPPCHYGFQFYTRELSEVERFEKWWVEYFKLPVDYFHSTYAMDIWEKEHSKSYPTRAISLMYNARSQDVPLGTPFNIASYALLLEIVGKMVNMIPDELIANMGDCHIYLNQIDGVKEQLTREPYELPTVKISDRIVNDISEYTLDDIILENYQSHPAIKMILSN